MLRLAILKQRLLGTKFSIEWRSCSIFDVISKLETLESQFHSTLSRSISQLNSSVKHCLDAVL